MRTTVTIDDDLLATAKRLTEIEETPTLVRTALKQLVERESARRLALLGGSFPEAKAAPRWRSALPEGAEDDDSDV